MAIKFDGDHLAGLGVVAQSADVEGAHQFEADQRLADVERLGNDVAIITASPFDK